MTKPHGVARVPVGAHHIDNGFLGDAALREIRERLEGIPAAAPILVDLGPLRRFDLALCWALAPYWHQVRFEGNWWVVQQYLRDLSDVPGLVV
jgi:hypothetical protein